MHQPKSLSSSVIGLIEEKSAAAFEQQVASSLPTPRTLYSEKLGTSDTNRDQFKGLASALGANLIGDNQLTVPNTGADSRTPAFHLESARVEMINGKNVIAIDGWFNRSGDNTQPKTTVDEHSRRFYTGIFFDADGKSTKVDELYLIADDQASFDSNRTIFNNALSKIKWR